MKYRRCVNCGSGMKQNDDDECSFCGLSSTKRVQEKIFIANQVTIDDVDKLWEELKSKPSQTKQLLKDSNIDLIKDTR